MPAESARQEWEEGYRRIEAERGERRRYRALVADVDAIRDELRRRIGQTFTLSELADVYLDADAWMRELVSHPRELPQIGAAAFHLHARAATDYAP